MFVVWPVLYVGLINSFIHLLLVPFVRLFVFGLFIRSFIRSFVHPFVVVDLFGEYSWLKKGYI